MNTFHAKKSFGPLRLAALASIVVLSCKSSSGGGGGGTGGDNGGQGGDMGIGGDGNNAGGAGGADSGGSIGSGGGAGSGTGGASGGSSGASSGGSGGTGGGAGSALVDGIPRWCKDPQWRVGAQDGEHTSADIKLSTESPGDPGAFVPKLPATVIPATATSTNWDAIYVPGGYADAKDGEVALFMGFSAQDLSTKVRNLIGTLSETGQIPVTIAVHATFDATNAARVSALIADVKTHFPKLSSKPEYRVMTGQSTAGAQVFDYVWANPGIVANVIPASGSFVCFMANWPYDDLITIAAKKAIRVSMSVGTCDIFGECALRMAAGCSGCAAGGQVDSSVCHMTWIDENHAVAAALQAKGYPWQLIVVEGGQHNGSTWQGLIGDQIRWVFRPLVCK